MEINKHIIFYPLDSKFIKNGKPKPYGNWYKYEDKKKVLKERRGKWKSIVR